MQLSSSSRRVAAAAPPAAARRRRALQVVAFKEEADKHQRKTDKHPHPASRAGPALDKILHRNQQHAPDSAPAETGDAPAASSTAASTPKQQQSAAPAASSAAPASHGQHRHHAAARKVAPLPAAFEAPLSVPVFSRRREVFVGRAAMAGFFASVMWESHLLGPGPIAQLHVLSGLPTFACQALLGAFVLHGLSGLLPGSRSWSAENRADLLRRPRGPPRAWVNPFARPADAFAFSDWGFTKANELFAGRLAMLGFLGTCWAEPFAHGGALTQLAWWAHLPTPPVFYQACNLLLLACPVVFGVYAYARRSPGQLRGGDDVY